MLGTVFAKRIRCRFTSRWDGQSELSDRFLPKSRVHISLADFWHIRLCGHLHPPDAFLSGSQNHINLALLTKAPISAGICCFEQLKLNLTFFSRAF